MLTLIRLQYRRLFVVWLTVPLFLLGCGCLSRIPEGLSAGALATGFGLLFLMSLIPVLVAVLVIWAAPSLRCVFDFVIPLLGYVVISEAAMSLLGVPENARTFVGLVPLLLILYLAFGGQRFGRLLWFRYRDTGRVILPGTPDELWPRLVPQPGAEHVHFVPNLLSVTPDPVDATRMQARFAMQKGTILTMDYTNVRQARPLSFRYDHTGDSPLLNGALATGSFKLALSQLTSASFVVFSIWLDNFAQDEAELARETLTNGRKRSLCGHSMRSFMKAYRKNHPA